MKNTKGLKILGMLCLLIILTSSIQSSGRPITNETISSTTLSSIDFPYNSPVKIGAVINRQAPETTISDREMNILATKFDLISGLDGHGYDFPGIISRFREINTNTPVLSYGNTMDIIPSNDERTPLVDREESVFFHSADPASLRVISVTGVEGTFTTIWFKQDARVRETFPNYTPPGVDYYQLEEAENINGPWTIVGDQISEDDTGDLISQITTPVYVATFEGYFPEKWYRVRSFLHTTQELVNYSWPTQPEPPMIDSLPITVLSNDGSFSIVYFGLNTPPSPENVVILCDLDLDRQLGEAIIPGERTLASSMIQEPSYTVYLGTVTQIQTRTSYQAQLVQQPTITCPLNDDSYTLQDSYNNRLQNSFGSLLVKPTHPRWITMMLERLNDALNVGYNGLRLDFAYDNIELNWISNAPVSSIERDLHNQLPDMVASFLHTLKTAHPESIILFNGYFVIENKNNYNRYLEEADGADFEFFAFGFGSPSDTQIDPRTGNALQGMIENHQQTKIASALTYTGTTNTAARMKALILYLLGSNEKTYFYVTVDSIYQSIPYFPEWDVPLGNPVQSVDNITDIVHPSLYLYRDFANGAVYFNPTENPITIQFEKVCFKYSVKGGYAPDAGGLGRATYQRVRTITIQPGDGTIILYQKPLLKNRVCSFFSIFLNEYNLQSALGGSIFFKIYSSLNRNPPQ